MAASCIHIFASSCNLDHFVTVFPELDLIPRMGLHTAQWLTSLGKARKFFPQNVNVTPWLRDPQKGENSWLELGIPNSEKLLSNLAQSSYTSTRYSGMVFWLKNSPIGKSSFMATVCVQKSLVRPKWKSFWLGTSLCQAMQMFITRASSRGVFALCNIYSCCIMGG